MPFILKACSIHLQPPGRSWGRSCSAVCKPNCQALLSPWCHIIWIMWWEINCHKVDVCSGIKSVPCREAERANYWLRDQLSWQEVPWRLSHCMHGTVSREESNPLHQLVLVHSFRLFVSDVKVHHFEIVRWTSHGLVGSRCKKFLRMLGHSFCLMWTTLATSVAMRRKLHGVTFVLSVRPASCIPTLSFHLLYNIHFSLCCHIDR